VSKLRYPKTYATVAYRDTEDRILALTEGGQSVPLTIGDRLGYGHASDIQPGLGQGLPSTWRKAL
jgi:hypothetical protein